MTDTIVFATNTIVFMAKANAFVTDAIVFTAKAIVFVTDTNVPWLKQL